MKIKRFLASIFVMVILQSLTFVMPAKADDDSGAMNFDVVFAVDDSGSMSKSDENRLAIEAIKLFIDLCDQKSCRIGFAAYGGEIDKWEDIVPLNDNSTVSKLKKSVNEIPYSQMKTNIALGLEVAHDILKEAGSLDDASRKPMIVLLSDGVTDLLDPAATEAAQNHIWEVISSPAEDENQESGSKFGVPVYTVGLNYDGSLDVETMKRIAKETGGIYNETVTADELPDIIMKIFKDYNNIKETPISDVKESKLSNSERKSLGLADNIKDYELTFNVESKSVNCTNIIIKHIDGKVNDFRLTNEDGFQVEKKHTNKVKVSKSNSYTVIKLDSSGSAGIWKLELFTESIEGFRIQVLNTYTVYAELFVNEADLTRDILSGEIIPITTFVMEDEGVIDDVDLMNQMSCKTYMKKVNSDEEPKAVGTPTKEGVSFVTDVTFSSPGAYEIYSEISTDMFTKKSDTITIYVTDKWNFSTVDISIENKEIEYEKSFNIISSLYNEGKLSSIGDKQAQINIVKKDTNKVVVNEQMVRDIDRGIFSYTYEAIAYTLDKGTYSAVVAVCPEAGGEPRESDPIEFTIIPKKPVVVDDYRKYTLYLNFLNADFFKNEDSVFLSDLIQWDKDDELIFDYDLGNVTNLRIEPVGDDYKITIIGKNVGTSNIQLKVTDKHVGNTGSVDIVIDVIVLSWWDKVKIPVIISAVALLLLIIIIIKTRPKLKGQSITISINVADNNIPVPPRQVVILPKSKTKADLYTVLENNEASMRALEDTIKTLDMQEILENIMIVPRSRVESKKLNLIVSKCSKIGKVGDKNYNNTTKKLLDEQCEITFGNECKLIIRIIKN